VTGFATIDEACDLVTDGTHYTPKNVGDGIPFLTVKDVTNWKLDFVNCSFVTHEDYQIAKAGNSAPQRGDVLFSKDGTVGKVHVVMTDDPFAVLSSLAILRPKKKRVDSKYLGHVLRSPMVLEDALKRKTGSAIRRIVLSDLKCVQIPLPSLSEQRRITEVLDRAEALRAKRRAALAQLDTLIQSIFLDLFGDPVRNDRTWPTAKIGDLCELVRGSSPRPQGDSRFFGGSVPRLMVADITRDGLLVTPRIDSLTIEGAKRSRPVPAGTVVMAVSGNIGLVSRLAIDACVHDGFVAFTGLDEDKVRPDFLLYLLNYSKATHERHKAGAIFINLTTTDIKNTELIQPPLTVQREFARRVGDVEKLKTVYWNSLRNLETLFSALQHRAFRGEL
jgi:type I restriction enzyme, S subunit